MKLRKNIVAFVLSLLLCLPIFLPAHAGAQTRTWGEMNLGCVVQENVGGQTFEVATLVGVECIAANILSIGVSAVGIASFVMLLIGSVMFLTSGGDPRKTEVGSKTMSYAAFGLIVSVSGWIIINFLSTFTGVDTFKTFQIKVGS